MPLEFLEKLSLFGNKLVDLKDMGELLLRFGLDIIVVYIVVRLIFYPIYRQKNFLFSFFLVNISIFLVCALLSTVKLKIGFAFGMFAVFSIIRYRTEPIPIKEMTYLFVIIIVAVINSLSIKKISYGEILFSNFAILLTVYLLEKAWVLDRNVLRRVRYEKIELIKPEKRKELIADLKERLGLDVERVEIERINFLNDTARLRVFYREKRPIKAEESK